MRGFQVSLPFVQEISECVEGVIPRQSIRESNTWLVHIFIYRLSGTFDMYATSAKHMAQNVAPLSVSLVDTI